MSVIKNIFAGDNIIVENIDDESVRIHVEEGPKDITRELIPYMNVYQATDSAGYPDYTYFTFNNCVMKINGEYIELDDFRRQLTTMHKCYDIYVEIKIASYDKDNFKLQYYINYKVYLRDENKYYPPESVNEHHLFRVIRGKKQMEYMRMFNAILEVTCFKSGFTAYHNYRLCPVKNVFGGESNKYAIPAYNASSGPLTIDTPFRKSAEVWTGEKVYLIYDGAGAIKNVYCIPYN